MNRRYDRRLNLVIPGVFAAITTFAFCAQSIKSPTDAASLDRFNPGNIISDYMMGNSGAMTEAQIQEFLTSKNSCANTDEDYYNRLSQNVNYKWRFKDGHFVCLSEELFGDGEVIGEGETAAHIIWQAAQDYGINPQVLLVLLQKETGLITDPIPNDKDYRKATGYGCPDTAACSEKYYGFKNQIRNAAKLFHTVLTGGWTNFPLGDNYIQYNPNAACGGSVVNIQNLATSSLYRYTPYQPNVGAIAAGYGTAECGAYGNRNFYLYFSDWFGDPTFVPVVQIISAPQQVDYRLNENGKIEVSWQAPANSGETPIQKYEIEVKNAYGVSARATISDVNQTSYVFEKIPAGVYVSATVVAYNETESSRATIEKQFSTLPEFTNNETEYGGFKDMPEDETSKQAVSWAVNNGITDANEYFNGEQALTRRQAMVLLWRISGQPESEIYEGFKDMPEGETSKQAVSWAVNNGITDANEYFNGEQALTRRQAMVLLWRISCQPEAEIYNNFKDMPEDGTSKKAVSWAANGGITDKNEYFNGEQPVTRRQTMVLLWRYIKLSFGQKL